MEQSLWHRHMIVIKRSRVLGRRGRRSTRSSVIDRPSHIPGFFSVHKHTHCSPVSVLETWKTNWRELRTSHGGPWTTKNLMMMMMENTGVQERAFCPCPRPETVDSTSVTGLCILSSLCIKWRRCADVFLCCCLLYTALYMTGCNYAVSLSVFTNLDGNTVSRHAWRGRAGSVEETLREKSERAANKRLNGDKKNRENTQKMFQELSLKLEVNVERLECNV